jgi:hypothetical protein
MSMLAEAYGSRFQDETVCCVSTLRKVSMMARPHFQLCMSVSVGMTPALWLLVRTFLTVICLLVATGCDEASPAGPTPRLNQQFTLAPGEVAEIESTTLRVQFVGVTGDSRCPADVVCIQGGDALVHIHVAGEGSIADYELHTGDSSRATVMHQGMRIQLVDLQPYPFSSRAVAPGDYRATLVVAR